MKRGIQGSLTRMNSGKEQFSTYFPYPLPPEINYPEIGKWLEKANTAIGELNGVIEALPDPDSINYMYMKKEAVLSSQIEGKQSTFDDLLRYEASQTISVPVRDVVEISSYVKALDSGLERLHTLPVSLRLIREVHEVLLTDTRGSDKMPGEFRRSQNWIGGTRPGNAHFVPVGPDQISEALDSFEKFMAHDDDLPILVKAAMLHYQFETIHAFLDGNGRVGRLLITLYLTAQGFLHTPYLYLSLFFKKHRSLYYEYLDTVRFTGDWEVWINFFLEGIVETAEDAKNTLNQIQTLFKKDTEAVNKIGRARLSATLVLEQFKQKPVLSISEIMSRTGYSRPTAISAVNRLRKLEILSVLKDKKTIQLYVYEKFVGMLRS
ncbi:MAG: Fic family protein [Sphaerochaeta sp.]|nr:Fic family protein [Sphaerochaeta sp.]